MADVTITITRKRKPASKGKRRRKGLLADNRKHHDLGRRRVKKAGGIINLYEMRMQWNGSAWEDRDFDVVPAIVPVGPKDLNVESLADSNWQAVRDGLLAITSLTTSTRKLTKTRADNYGADLSAILQLILSDTVTEDLNSSNARWTDDGITVDDPIQKIALYAERAFAYMFDTSSAFVKVTSSPTYGASVVTPHFSGNIDVFLCPALVGAQGYSILDPDDTTDYDGMILGGAYYGPIPDALWDDTSNYNDANYLRGLIVGNDDYRGWTGDGPHSFTPGGTVDTSPPSENLQAGYISIDDSANDLFNFDPTSPEGMLLAIIKTATSTYYVWGKSGWAWSPTGVPYASIT